MHIKKRAAAIVERLKTEYPAACSLTAESDWQLLFATRLSAQCTDARVNLVTPVLYEKYPTLSELAYADIVALEEIIKPCGLFHTKAKDIKAGALYLLEKHGGTVPDTMEALLKIPGVGRKTANLILGDIFSKPAIVADTHCIRISNRLGLCKTKDPYGVEKALAAIIAPVEQSDLCHRLVFHGRASCRARAPQCESCCVHDLCPKIGV